MTLLKDVAKYAGVSTATVSRVLNTPDIVKEETRDKVNKAIAELGYRPNRVARRLSGRRDSARMISLVIPDIQNPFYGFVARGVEDVANANNCTLILGNADGNPDKEEMYLNILRAESVDGIIAPPISEKEESLIVNLVEKENIPIVSIDGPLKTIQVDNVLVDNKKGAYEVVERFIFLGHRRIGFVCGPLYYLGFQERYDGYIQAHQDHGIEVDEGCVRIGESSQESAARLTLDLLELEYRPTALFTADNLITTGALEAIVRAFHPPLSTVRQSAYKLGQTAATLLFERIDDPTKPPQKVVLEPELIIRESCAPLEAQVEIAQV